MPETATPEEVRRVRETECQEQGHSFDVVQTFGSADPQKVVCSRCGKWWEVLPFGVVSYVPSRDFSGSEQ
jgi:DNA-directed RNA polymerase subunit M/transcription elongation factor TFIIS